MSTRKRGRPTVTTDELTIERNKRARAAEGDKPIPADTPPVPDPPPVPFLGSLHQYQPPTVAVFAAQMLMADTYARLAKDAGMLNVGTSEAAAKLLILRGFEMGIPPLRALNELYLSSNDRGGGEIVEEATLMRALVAASGLGVIEPLPKLCNAQTATVRAIRHDYLGHRVEEFTFTMDDAAADGLLLKPNWQSGANREALLTARATAKAKRAMFSDVESPRYTHDELGGGSGGAQEGSPVRAAPSPPPPSQPAPVSAPITTGTPPVSGDVSGVEAGAISTGGPHPPVAPPPGTVAESSAPLPSPPPRQEPNHAGPSAGASRQEKMAYYADVARAMHRPWTQSVGMTRDAQPVPIVTHGVQADQITQILNYTVAGRTDFPRANEALKLVIDHLGTLSIDTGLLPTPYCFFALTQDEAEKILQGLDAFARSDVEGDDLEEGEIAVEAEAPEDPRAVVQDGQHYSWVQANDYLEAVLRRLTGHATRGDVMGMLHQAYRKEFYELTPDELFAGAADLDRLGKNPTVLKQAIDRMRIQGGG